MVAAETTQPHVVVGVDGSAESVEALRWAASYAAATSASITVVISWHDPPAGLVPAGQAPPGVSADVRASMQAALEKALTDVFGTATPASVTARVSYGHPAMVLVDESKDADLLVVGRRGHGAFTGMMLGSVSIHCVTNAVCPVVVVRGS
jgi:nucleotide-binding universal stress UspA family protein